MATLHYQLTSKKEKHFMKCLIILLSIVCGNSAPISPEHFEFPSASAMKFMKTFGYLESGTSHSEALYQESAIIDAVKTLQKFGNISQTGIFDNDTLKLIEKQRCGVPDVIRHKEDHRRKRYIIASEGWKKRDITYYIANWSPKLGEEAVAAEIGRAFEAWSGYARLNFRRVNDPSADIIIAFGSGYHGDRYPFDGTGNVLAHAFFPYEMESYGGDIHFDDDEDWKVIRSGELMDGTDFFTVAVHELGHSLGLAHSPVPSSIMFPYYRGYTPNFQLDYDDILGMYQLYISRHLEGDNITTERSSTDSGVEVTTTAKPSYGITQETSTESYVTVESTTGSFPSSTSIGDDETREEDRGHEADNEESGIPDICDGYFDAISVLRGELFIFKGQYIWRLCKRGKVQSGYPVKFHQLFRGIPQNFTQIDAAYERETDSSIILFTGNQYWIYDGNKFIDNSPRPLTDYGIPANVDKLDAVQVWGKNGKTYLYRNDQFWRFNETSRSLDQGYPYNMRRWRGVPTHIDAAMTWIDGQTYFFKGTLFWRFDNFLIMVDDHYPLPAPQYWAGCPERLNTVWW